MLLNYDTHVLYTNLLVALIAFAFYPVWPFAHALNANYTNGRYKIYQIRPNTAEQIEELNRMEQMGMIDFWRPPPGVDSIADVMIDVLNNGMQFLQFLRKNQIHAKVLVDDLSKLIEEKEILPTPKHKLMKALKRGEGEQEGVLLRDDVNVDTVRFDGFGLRMGEYYDFNDITTFMQNVQNSLPGRAQIRTIGWTVEGRPIQGIQFGNPFDLNRLVVWIDAGIHAREWTAVHTAIYFIFYIANQLRSGQDQRLLRILDKVDIIIFPCLNPDGYEYTRSEPRNPAVRMWRKNRSKERCITDRDERVRCCKGVDLNRNFDFKFAEGGTSFYPCSEVFHGANAFSEPETRAVRDAIMGTDLKGRVPALITMHAYSQLWIYPYSHRRHSYPADVDELKSVARRAVIAIADKFGTNYQYGTGPETIYAYTGGSSDWAKETAQIKYTYTIELRPSYSAWNGFVLDHSQLIPTARETFDGVMIVLETVARDANMPPPSNAGNAANRRSIFSVPKTEINAPNDVPARPILNANPPMAKILPDAIKCEDAMPYCASWLKNNSKICANSQATMRRDCRRTCSFC